ncbi:hypothetical protein A2U01_0115913, partial [Trifolium medium]|nr:hypothetical protein [Trifolium medium]
SRAPPDSPTSGIRAVIRLGGGPGVDPGIGSTTEWGRECWVSSVSG